MCIGPNVQGPLCDECFANISDHPDPQLEDLCEKCQEAAKHYCFCCETGGHKELNEDGLCKQCEEDGYSLGGDDLEASS